MNTTEIITEIRRLPLARNGAVEKLIPRLESLAARLAAHGISVRRGGYRRSTSYNTTYLYATIPGSEEARIWECNVESGGHFTPISGIKFAAALDELESIIPAELRRNPASNKLRAYIATNEDGSEKRWLLTADQAPTCAEGAAYLRNVWCLPVVSLRDQLSTPERAVFNDDVRDMLTAMAE